MGKNMQIVSPYQHFAYKGYNVHLSVAEHHFFGKRTWNVMLYRQGYSMETYQIETSGRFGGGDYSHANDAIRKAKELIDRKLGM